MPQDFAHTAYTHTCREWKKYHCILTAEENGTYIAKMVRRVDDIKSLSLSSLLAMRILILLLLIRVRKTASLSKLPILYCSS